MNPELPEEAVALQDAAAKAFAALGGVELARRAELDPTLRTTEVAPVLAELGIDDLDPRADAVALAAAAALCEAAGRVALPYPVAAALVRDADGRPTAAVPTAARRVDHGDLFDHWRVGTLDGTGGVARHATPTGVAGPAATATTDAVGPSGTPPTAGAVGPAGEVARPPGTALPGARLGTRLGPFVVDLEPVDGDAGSAPPPVADVLLHVTLSAWSVLGTVDRAVELAVEHVTGRHQFGKPLSAFQAVQFQLADAAVAVAGLRELAGFTLWRLESDPAAARPDVLALRLHALEVARAVLRTSQQLHGAAGVCDEYDVSVLTRMVQPALRLPAGVEHTVTALAEAIRVAGFEGLFPHGATAR